MADDEYQMTEDRKLQDLLDRLNRRRNHWVWSDPGASVVDALTMLLDRLENVEEALETA